MAKTLSLEPTVYVLKSEREVSEEEQTKWYLRPLKWRERADIQDGMFVTEINMLGHKDKKRQGLMRHLSGTQARVAIEKGLVKVENLQDHEGNEAKFGIAMNPSQKEPVLDLLPPQITKEIAEEILRMSGLLEEEEKN